MTLATSEYNCTYWECTNSTLPSIVLESIWFKPNPWKKLMSNRWNCKLSDCNVYKFENTKYYVFLSPTMWKIYLLYSREMKYCRLWLHLACVGNFKKITKTNKYWRKKTINVRLKNIEFWRLSSFEGNPIYPNPIVCTFWYAIKSQSLKNYIIILINYAKYCYFNISKA